MMRFVTPLSLLLLLLLPLLWGLALLGPDSAARRRAWRFWGSLTVRSLAFVAIIFALAGAELMLPARDLTVVFLLDRSDSVPLAERDRADAYVQQALDLLPVEARAGIVAFGQHALIARLPSGERALSVFEGQPGGAATNIADAIRVALGLLPAAGRGRLVLLSDGGATEGDTEQAARTAAARGVSLEVVPLTSASAGLDAQISGISVPPAVRAGQQLPMVLDTTSTAAVDARVIVRDNGKTVLTQAIQVPAGSGRLELALPEPLPAFNRYEVQLEVAGDTRPENNRAETFSLVEGRPSVLLVEGSAGEARNLQAALAMAKFNVKTIAPAGMPNSLAALSDYDALVLVDVPLWSLPAQAMTLLPAYVHDLGRGLAMIGGTDTFGPGGYRGSPIEAALPITMDPRSDIAMPAVGIVVVMDVSGSMAAEEDGVAKVHLAATGAARVAAQIRDDDEITVIPFDSTPHNTIGPWPGYQRDEVIARLNRVGTEGGGITMLDALVESARYLRSSAKPVRHLITITDGNDTTQHEGSPELVSKLHDEGITVTSVAVGDGRDVPFLKDIARIGAGRFFLTSNATSIPSILVDETQILLRPYLQEGPFTPHQSLASAPGGAGILHGITSMPQLYGYVASTPRNNAQVLLQTPRNDPLLATWQYGLGRSLVWTSDLKGKWAGDLVRWNEFPQLVAQMMSWLMSPPGSPRLGLEARTSGSQLVLSAHAREDDSSPASGLHIAGELLAADGSVRSVVLHEVTPGSYGLAAGELPPGAYQIRLVAAGANGQPFATIGGGAVIGRADEYRGQAGDRRLLDRLARITGGRVEPLPAGLYDSTQRGGERSHDIALPLLWLALGLLPIEIAIRRLWGWKSK
jgi:uncharacterized membrane protein